MKQTNVLIGIQARSTSSRFPNKIYEKLGKRTVLGHVIKNALTAASYINAHNLKNNIHCRVALLIPKGDQAKNHAEDLPVIEGPEENVFERYMLALEAFQSDYLVRITADCPLLPPPIISSHIFKATRHTLDYCSNVDEKLRTVPDGWDCEVISARAMKWLDEHNDDMEDYEHVTTLLRREKPKELQFGHVVGYLNLKDLKLSIDTPEDLERIRDQFEYISMAVREANSECRTFRH